MKQTGLSHKHSGDDPLLKAFSDHLEKTQKHKYFQQDVDNVARFLYHMDSSHPSLGFVSVWVKTLDFISELEIIGLSKQTQVNYLKSIRKFLRYQTAHTDLASKDGVLYQQSQSYLVSLDQLIRSHKRDGNSKSPRRSATMEEDEPTVYDCQAVLRAAKQDFVAVLKKASSKSRKPEIWECSLATSYLQAALLLKHLQPPTAVEHMTIEDWFQRQRAGGDGYAVVAVKTKKVSTRFALTQEEEDWFQTYFTLVRPLLFSTATGKRKLDDLEAEDRFFLSTAGVPIHSASNDLERLQAKYKLEKVSSQLAHKAYRAAIRRVPVQEKSQAADQTPDTSSERGNLEDVIAARALLDKLTSEPSPGCLGESLSSPTAPPCSQMTLQAAFDQLLQSHPVTLDGKLPSKAVRYQLSPRHHRRLYERWAAQQRELRIQHAVSHFPKRQPTKPRLASWIKKQAWKNAPTTSSILAAWRPSHSMEDLTDSEHIRHLVKTQNWRGLHITQTEGKGMGVTVTRTFHLGEVICDYHGKLISGKEGQEVHKATDPDHTGYMFFYKRGEKQMCIDAHLPRCDCHPEKDTLGRLINHGSTAQANVKPRLVSMDIDGVERDVILFIALKTICVGEEVLFHYGVEKSSFGGEGLDLEWL
ncbi:uncharacterized protein LOC121628474 [Melanotaenia boesemani]|uniref:uncharacterized protein LOC121628474 n=1 Tax=Melanotaenia boesemani TaxID=1250792 RepID=UPI001C05C59C|nr:uncharacterized protein LOC121628474 [Melanotaenia boesemani]